MIDFPRNGEYVIHKERKPEGPQHNCWKPGGVYGDNKYNRLNTLPLPSIGDVWQCDCGQYWRYGHPPFMSDIAWDPITERKALKIAKRNQRKNHGQVPSQSA